MSIQIKKNYQKTVLDHALYYQDLGLNVIPVNYRAKNPLVYWKSYQTKKVTKKDLKKWFPAVKQSNLGIICTGHH